MGLFASPNRAGIMNSLPPRQRGAGAGMTATFQNSAMVLSIGLFFTLIIIGLSARLPATLYSGLTARGVPAASAARISHLPPTSALFAAFLGYNPVRTLLGPVLAHLPHATAAYLAGRAFFPRLISPPFMAGLREAFDFAAAACAVAAIASWLRGGKYYYTEPEGASLSRPTQPPAPRDADPHPANTPGSGEAHRRTVEHREAFTRGRVRRIGRDARDSWRSRHPQERRSTT